SSGRIRLHKLLTYKEFLVEWVDYAHPFLGITLLANREDVFNVIGTSFRERNDVVCFQPVRNLPAISTPTFEDPKQKVPLCIRKPASSFLSPSPVPFALRLSLLRVQVTPDT